APTQPSQMQSSSRPMGSDTSGRLGTPPLQPTAPPSAPSGPITLKSSQVAAGPIKIPKEEVLIKAYEKIKSGKIKSPETIRKIASDFLVIANDPEASKKASFDAARAAQTLLDRAQLYEDQASMDDVYADDTPTQAEWPPYQY